MNHQFNIEIATNFGVDVAIFLENIAFWTQRNIANRKNFKDGQYWVYNSLDAWTILFPYWSLQNIRTIIDKCINNGLLVKNNSLNKRKADRTCWYSMTEKAIELYSFIKSILDKKIIKNDEKVIHTHLLESTNDMLELTNAFVRINTALPDNKPDNKQQIKSFYKKDQKICNEKKHNWAEMKNEAAHIKENERYKNVPIEVNMTYPISTVEKENNPVRNPFRQSKPDKSPTHYTDALKIMGERLARKDEYG